MKIVYPYNEILPLRKAHDSYVIRNCHALAQRGHQVTLLVGKGSESEKQLLNFYALEPHPLFEIKYLPILRKQHLLPLQWNGIFFYAVQKYLEKTKPDWVICSVLKQAAFHLNRRIEGCQYFYEVHQLGWYPTLQGEFNWNKIHLERLVYNKSDAISVTTLALEKLLRSYPYQCKTPLYKIPLACDFLSLEKKEEVSKPFKLFYIGQLYPYQGIDFLLSALKETPEMHLVVVGGKSEEVLSYRQRCQKYAIESRVTFEGFLSTQEMLEKVKQADAFVCPFKNCERMPYVAHTKLREYAALKRPIVAPNLDVVREEVPQGALFYQADQVDSLSQALNSLLNLNFYQKLMLEIHQNESFTWEKRGHLFNTILTKLDEKISQKIGAKS